MILENLRVRKSLRSLLQWPLVEKLGDLYLANVLGIGKESMAMKNIFKGNFYLLKLTEFDK